LFLLLFFSLTDLMKMLVVLFGRKIICFFLHLYDFMVGKDVKINFFLSGMFFFL